MECSMYESRVDLIINISMWTRGKKKLAKMEEDAKRDLGILPEKEFSPEDIRGKFIEGTTHLKRRKESGRKPAHLGVILAIIALLIFLWHYLQTGSWSF